MLLRRQGDDDAREIAYEGYVAHTVLDDLLERRLFQLAEALFWRQGVEHRRDRPGLVDRDAQQRREARSLGPYARGCL